MRQKWNTDQPGLVSGLLAFVAIAAYLPAIYLGFVNYDDPLYVTDNMVVQKGLSWRGITWAFSEFHAANWHPLTWLSHMTDVQIWGMRAGGHHITNVVFHAANCVLLFLWLRSMTGACWRSALVAALFAVHPLHVESVAWVSERKDVLSTFFGILSLWGYTRYAQASRLGYYLISLTMFALGLASKPMLVTWPFVMLLMDYWPLQRMAKPAPIGKSWGALVLEKIPFFALSAASSVVTFYAQQAGEAVASLRTVPLDARIANALVAYMRYAGKIVWPANLAVIYPAGRQSWLIAGATLLLLLAATLLAFGRRKAQPYLLVGWLWFLGTLVPVIGLVQVGNQSIADRYTYVPAIGLFIMLAWGCHDLAVSSPGFRRMAVVAASAALLALVVVTEMQLSYWKDSESLFRHALTVTKNNFVAWNNLGFFLAGKGKPDEAEICYGHAVEFEPAFAEAWYNRGCALADLGRDDEAITALETAIRLNPQRPRPHNNLASVLAQQGKWDAAAAEFKEALTLDPTLGRAQCGLAGVLAKQGRFEEAIDQLSVLLKRDPGDIIARLQLGGTYAMAGKTDLAMREYLEVARSMPTNATAHHRIAALQERQGNVADAIREYRAAIQARPDYVEAMNNLAWILATSPDARYRDGAEAVRLAERACQATHYEQAFMVGTLAAAYAESARFPEAVATAEKAELLANNSNNSDLATKTGKLLLLYRARKPYHDVSE